MSYVDPQTVEKAREMDLLTYLQNYEPNELVRLSDGTYCTRTHDSLKISNGKWMWWSRGFGAARKWYYLVSPNAAKSKKHSDYLQSQNFVTLNNI